MVLEPILERGIQARLPASAGGPEGGDDVGIECDRPRGGEARPFRSPTMDAQLATRTVGNDAHEVVDPVPVHVDRLDARELPRRFDLQGVDFWRCLRNASSGSQIPAISTSPIRLNPG